MCTAVSFHGNTHCFGRNLDLDYSYNESVTIIPRNFPIVLKNGEFLSNHFAFIGTAYVYNGYPLLYDGTNEYGLSVCGLNFPDNAYYFPPRENMFNITPFEIIPWILSLCKNVSETREKLLNTNVTNIPYCEELPLTPLHWMISDREKSIVAEPTKNGLKIYDNPSHVLTNSPDFSKQLFSLNNYMSLSNENPKKSFSDKLPLTAYSRGMGAVGLPGDWSSQSRFVRASFVSCNSLCDENDLSTISQFFHILKSVAHPRGVVKTNKGKYQITVYSSCCDTNSMKYYYTTYNNSSISCVDMRKEELDGNYLFVYPMIQKENVYYQN